MPLPFLDGSDEMKRDPAPMSGEDGDIPRIPSGSDEAGTERRKRRILERVLYTGFPFMAFPCLYFDDSER